MITTKTFFMRRCSCVKDFAKAVYRWTNIVFAENRESPIGPVKPTEWALKSCPHCHGEGFVPEVAVTQREIDAMIRDFESRMGYRK